MKAIHHRIETDDPSSLALRKSRSEQSWLSPSKALRKSLGPPIEKTNSVEEFVSRVQKGFEGMKESLGAASQAASLIEPLDSTTDLLVHAGEAQ